ncbi:MAG: hypothetical protein ACP5E2_06425 [Terracidiphilus sp.]
MKFRLSFAFLTVFAFAFAAAMDGCKSTPQQATNMQQVNGSPMANGTQPANGMQPVSNAPQASNYGSPSSNSQPPASAPVAGQAQQAPPPPSVVDLPAGTNLSVRLDQDLGSKISQPGDNFAATIADDVIVNGQTVIARGARAEGTVIDAEPLGRFKGGARLVLRLERVRTNWGSYPVATSTISRAEKGKGKRTGIFTGGGAALGAIIGGIAGGGKGALIGGLTGAGAGAAGSAFTGNKEILLPAETLLTFHLDHSVHITE